jgi:uncharacterized lipoprotein YddW (UPF0748 family)
MALASTGCHGSRWGLLGKAYGSKPIRAIWVTRWDYKSASDIARVMDNCKNAGFNTVLFQVRGAGTVAYRSKIEPWAEEFGGHDPGFDPLSVACKEANRRGLSLHAWVNVIPGYRGKEPPRDPRQLYNAHPDWFLRDAYGHRQPLGWYDSLNPCYPEVRRYLTTLMYEIVSRYPVDGLHLDYARFPTEYVDSYGSQPVPDYPRDPRTLALFRKAAGKSPEQAPAAWDAWRTDCMTQVVRDIRGMMLKEKPKAALTAAVGPMPDEHRRKYFQDAQRWTRDGLVDAVYPMNYESDLRVYTNRLAAWTSMRPGVPVVTGVMFDKRNAGTVLAQVHEATRRGTHFAAFAYNSLFERLDRSGRPIMDDQSASRAALRNQLIPRLRRLATGVNRRYNRAAFDGRSDDEVHAQATNGTSCISGGLPL